MKTWAITGYFLFGIIVICTAFGANPDVNLATLRLAPTLGAADHNYSFAVYADSNFPVFASYAKDQNVIIDFNVWDIDLLSDGNFEQMVVDINYSTGSIGDVNYSIVTDLNLSTGICDSNNAPDANRYTCHYDWNIAGLGDYNVWLIVQIWDGNRETASSDTNHYAKATFRIDNNAPAVTNLLPTGLDRNIASTNLRVTTDSNATCKWGVTDAVFDSLPNVFATTNGLDHNYTDTNFPLGRIVRYVKCMDTAGNSNADSNTIDFNHSYRSIVINAPVSGTSWNAGVQTIDFNVIDYNGFGSDGNAVHGQLVRDMNVIVRYHYHTAAVGLDANIIADSNSIVSNAADANMSCVYDGNKVMRRCTLAWYTGNVPDGNYRLDINAWSYAPGAQNSGRYDFNATSASFALDTTAPLRSQLAPTGVDRNTSAFTLYVHTNEAATCKWGPLDVAYDSLPNTFDDINSTDHNDSDSNVGNYGRNVRYVRCSDGAGNKNTTSVGIDFNHTRRTISISSPSSSGADWNSGVKVISFVLVDYNGLGDTNSNAGLEPIRDLNIIVRYSPRAGALDGNVILDRNGLALLDGNVSCRIDSNIQRTCDVNWYTGAVTGDGTYYVDVNAYSFATGATGTGRFDVNATSAAIRIDRVVPTLSSAGPTGSLSSGSVTLTVTTNEAASCRYDTTSGRAFDAMTGSLGNSGSSGSHTASVSLPNASYIYYFVCRDLAGNTSGQTSATFTVSATTTTTSGGGGGGGGSPSTVTDSSTLVSVHNVSAGSYRELIVSNSSTHSIYQIAFTAGDAPISVANFSVAQKPTKPGYISAEPTTTNEQVYKKYLEITSNLSSAHVSGDFSIFFKVDKNWMSARSFDKTNVKLKRYVGSSWETLATAYVREDNDASGSYYYEAKTPGFSIFVVVAGPLVAGAGDSNEPGTPQVPPQDNPNNPGGGTTTGGSEDERNNGVDDSNSGVFTLPELPAVGMDLVFLGGAAFVAIALLGGIFYFALFRKSGKDAMVDSYLANQGMGKPRVMESQRYSPSGGFSFSLPKIEWPFGKKDNGLANVRGDSFSQGLRILESSALPKEKLDGLFKRERGLADGGSQWPGFLRKK